jgi:hypothetical protein
MPYGDGTGPAGAGPMTGRGAGFCAGFNTPGFANNGRGGMRGMGRGRRNMFYATGLPGWMRGNSGFSQAGAPAGVDPSVVRTSLEQQMAALQGQLDVIKQRLGALNTAGPQEKDA